MGMTDHSDAFAAKGASGVTADGSFCRVGRITRRDFIGGGVAAGAMVGASAHADAPPAQDPWPALASQIFPQRTLQDGAAFLAIEAPYRAEDAATVPITILTTMLPGDPRRIAKITLVIEANPSPVASVFTLSPDSDITRIATRVRVDDYTNVRAVAEMSDGTLYQVARFVKAAGGCSAPALKQSNDTIAKGTLRFREFAPGSDLAAGGRREAQVMVRHPNYSGMQMDQVSRLYIPADFIQTLHVWQGNRSLLAIEAGISISENPTFRFSFAPTGAKTFRIEAIDSEGGRFDETFPAATDTM